MQKGALYIILENLVNNSFKYGINEKIRQEGMEIVVKDKPSIFLDAKIEDPYIIFSYRDRTMGFDKASAEKIDEWMRGKGQEGRTGFGLQMIDIAYQSIVEKSNVEVKKEVNENGRYWVDFIFKFPILVK